jgi:type II secretory pathway pseudopilin PulG
MKPNPTRPSRVLEEGYILVAVIFMLAIFIITLAVAAPRVAKELQRDREIETMHRGKQYMRALQLYYRKFGSYPPNVDALVNTNQIRFLRKKYIDPTTGKDEWKPIHYGQNKAPTALGFFGQPLAGSTLAGIGPSGGGLASATNPLSGLSSPAGGSSILGSTGPGTSPTTTATGGSPDSSTGISGGTTAPGTNAPDASSASGTGTGLSGQTLGGGGIIGFSPGSPKQSILVYKKKNHYNEWEFVYDPIVEQMMQGGNTGTIGQPASSTTTPVGGQPAPPQPAPPQTQATPAPTQ